ncbi:hypothetical protein FNV43_RR13282 [Rhamnella rubrinervis]|uniref:GDP-D-glucose phosphorylase 1 n=1 Tax=Rhamnella rubrinervis TaxID=2594499 RepID=A0A8K0H0T0_9ROSA|nr:hypothetical protein FNV43_RR13282 [Rhamnella rubrinervis]
MLTIKRVATVVSNYQEEGSGTGLDQRVLGCGRNCLGKCCLSVSKLPLYAFNKDEEDTNENRIVTKEHSQILHGKYGFIAQLNEGRHLKKRPTEFRIDQVLQPFDEKSSISPKLAKKKCFSELIMRASCWLCIWQKKGDPFLRLGYNSLGAFATINHLHFQAYYLAVPYPVEKAPTERIIAGKGIEREETATSLSMCSSLIVGKESFVPSEKQALGEVSQDILETQVNPAVWEISGHIVLKRRKDFDEASEAYAWRLLAEVSLLEDRFEEVKDCILEAAGGLREVEVEDKKEEEVLYRPLSSNLPRIYLKIVWFFSSGRNAGILF